MAMISVLQYFYFAIFLQFVPLQSVKTGATYYYQSKSEQSIYIMDFISVNKLKNKTIYKIRCSSYNFRNNRSTNRLYAEIIKYPSLTYIKSVTNQYGSKILKSPILLSKNKSKLYLKPDNKFVLYKKASYKHRFSLIKNLVGLNSIKHIYRRNKAQTVVIISKKIGLLKFYFKKNKPALRFIGKTK